MGVKATSIPLHLTVDPWWDLLEVVAFGTTTDGVAAERWHGVTDKLGLLMEEDGETVLGFVVQEFASFDPQAVEEIWAGPRFDVPALGLWQATVGEIVLAVKGRYGEEEGTADAIAAHTAMALEDPRESLAQWRLALEAGDMKAHYAVGYSLCEVGDHRTAYDHLRTMVTLAPTNAWAWCWLGRACTGLGWTKEAREALKRAVELDGDETDAPELLAEMDAR